MSTEVSWLLTHAPSDLFYFYFFLTKKFEMLFLIQMIHIRYDLAISLISLLKHILKNIETKDTGNIHV